MALPEIYPSTSILLFMENGWPVKRHDSNLRYQRHYNQSRIWYKFKTWLAKTMGLLIKVFRVWPNAISISRSFAFTRRCLLKNCYWVLPIFSTMFSFMRSLSLFTSTTWPSAWLWKWTSRLTSLQVILVSHIQFRSLITLLQALPSKCATNQALTFGTLSIVPSVK